MLRRRGSEEDSVIPRGSQKRGKQPESDKVKRYSFSILSINKGLNIPKFTVVLRKIPDQ